MPKLLPPSAAAAAEEEEEEEVEKDRRSGDAEVRPRSSSDGRAGPLWAQAAAEAAREAPAVEDWWASPAPRSSSRIQRAAVKAPVATTSIFCAEKGSGGSRGGEVRRAASTARRGRQLPTGGLEDDRHSTSGGGGDGGGVGGGVGSCWWNAASRRREFSLGDAASWPRLGDDGGKVVVSGSNSGLDGFSRKVSAGAAAAAGGDAASTAQWERNTSRGWVRLPPLTLDGSSTGSSSSTSKRGFGEIEHQHKQQQQQQHKQQQQPYPSVDGAKHHQNRQLQQQQQKQRGSNAMLPMPPVLLMLNTDFIVTSPVKENLLLTLALTRNSSNGSSSSSSSSSASSSSSDDEDEENSTSKRIRRQVLIGRFEAFSSFVRFALGRDAKRVVTEQNAGGTSTISESLSVEYFVRRFQARDVVTEMEVEYSSMNWKKVDYICNLYGQRVGVSVTRAMSYPNPSEFSQQMAYRLLYKKLDGLVVARQGISDRHSFSQCILHVWCETKATAGILESQYKDVSEELEIADDVIMVLTVAEGWHARPIFYESCLHSRP